MKYLLLIFTSLFCMTQDSYIIASSSKDTSRNTSHENISTEVDPHWNWDKDPYDEDPKVTRTIIEQIEYEMFNDLEEQVQLSIMACKIKRLQDELNSLREQAKNLQNPTNIPSESNEKTSKSIAQNSSNILK